MTEAPKAGLLRILSTEDDANRVFDPIRIQFLVGSCIALLAMFGYIVFAGYHAIYDKTFDPVAYGTGFAAILGAFGTYVATNGVAIFMLAKAPNS